MNGMMILRSPQPILDVIVPIRRPHLILSSHNTHEEGETALRYSHSMFDPVVWLRSIVSLQIFSVAGVWCIKVFEIWSRDYDACNSFVDERSHGKILFAFMS